MSNFELLLAEMSPQTLGRIGGTLLVMCLLLAGILKCAQIARRPTTHALCVYSLLAFLAVWLVGGLSGGLAALGVSPPAVRLGLGMLMLNCMLASVAMAIIGIVDYDKRAAAYHQGRKQAIVALLGASLIFCLAGGGFLFEAARGFARSDAVAGSVRPAPGNSGFGRQPRTRRFEALNLHVELPDHPWVEVEAARLNPDATLALMRGRPPIYFMVIGERIGVEQTLSTPSLAELYRANLRSNMGNVRFSEERSESYAGMDGIAFGADATVGRQPIHYAAWVAAHQGFAYQFIAWSGQSAADEVDDALRQMCRRVQQIDPAEVAHSEGYAPVGVRESPGFGYRADFTGTQWTDWMEEDYATTGADFGASCGSSAALKVIALRLPVGAPDTEMLARAMLGALDIKYPGPMIRRAEPLEIGPLRGMEFEAQKRTDLGGTLDFRVRLLADQERAILIAGWVDETDTTGGKVIVDALDRFEFFAPTDAEPSMLQAQRASVGLILNDLGIASLQSSRPADAIGYFESAVPYRPDDSAVVENLVEALWLGRGADAALAAVRRSLEKFPDNRDLRARQAGLLAVNGDSAGAREAFAKLFADGHDDEDDLLTYINLSIDAEAFDEALAAIDRVLARRPSRRVRRWQATVHSRKGDHDRAIALLSQMREESPGEVPTAVSLADVFESKGDYSAALEITGRLLETGVDDEDTLMMHGRNQAGLQWYAQAKETFGKVLSRNPGNADAKEFYSFVSNMLGQGDNSLVTRPISPVEMPTNLREAIRDAGNPPNAADADAVELLRVVGVHFELGKPMRTTTWRKVKVLTTSGVTRYSTLTVGFDPAAERVFVNQLAVYDEDGKLVEKGSVDDYYVLDDSSSDTATQDKLLHVPVPALKPGRTLQFVTTIEEPGSAKCFRYQQFVLSAAVPIGCSAVYVRGDVSSLKFGASMPLKVEKASDLIYVLEREPTPYTWESLQPLTGHFLPVFWVGDAAQSWSEVSTAYLEQIKDKLTPTEETRRLAAELTAGCNTPREKVGAIAKYVQQACTYRAIEFGRRAQIPNTAAHTLRLKYGDCKDHAVLVQELLKAAGVTAHLALVATTGRVQPEVPSIDQFNHMVVYVPAGGAADAPATILDCTDKESYALLTPPPGLADKDLLVLDPSDPRLVRTPKYPADAARLVSERNVKIRAENGRAVETTIEEQVTLNEFAAPAMRAYLKSFAPADRQDAVVSWLTGARPLRLTSIEVEHLDEVEKPLVLKMSYASPEAFHRVPAGTSRALVGHLPASWETSYLDAEYIPQRKTPFELPMPLRIESTVTLELPSGYDLQNADQLVDRGNTRFVAWASRVTGKERLTLEYRARRRAGRHRAGDYAEYYDDARSALGVFHRPITLSEAAR